MKQRTKWITLTEIVLRGRLKSALPYQISYMRSQNNPRCYTQILQDQLVEEGIWTYHISEKFSLRHVAERTVKIYPRWWACYHTRTQRGERYNKSTETIKVSDWKMPEYSEKRKSMLDGGRVIYMVFSVVLRGAVKRPNLPTINTLERSL